MIVFSDMEIYEKIKEYDTIFIGLAIWNDYETTVENLKILINDEVKTISNSYIFLAIEILSEAYRKIEIINEEFIEYCGFTSTQVRIWSMSSYVSDNVSLFLKFSNCAAIIPMFSEFLKIFCTCDGNLDSFAEKANFLLNLYKIYMRTSRRYIISENILILCGSLEELKHLNFPSFPDDVFQDKYVSFLEAVERIKLFGYFSAEVPNTELFISEEDCNWLKTLKVDKVVYLNNESTEFGYATIINGITTISISCKKCTIIGQKDENLENYCCYDIITNEMFGETSSGHYFSYKCQKDIISENQAYFYEKNKLLLKLFKAKHVTFFYDKDKKEIIYRKNDIRAISFDEDFIFDYSQMKEEYEEEYDENYT